MGKIKVQNQIVVSELKAKLLAVIRAVEAGESFQVTKNGKPVAELIPTKDKEPPVVGFANIKILSDDIFSTGTEDDWTYDIDNIK